MKLKRFLNASMILAFLAMSQTALAQAFTVQGRVVDESGEPMIGVAVTNKDGNTLGVTDADGRYSIELNSPTKLKFTFVGSETITIDAKKATQKDIVMRQTATALDDVVVVGFVGIPWIGSGNRVVLSCPESFGDLACQGRNV